MVRRRGCAVFCDDARVALSHHKRRPENGSDRERNDSGDGVDPKLATGEGGDNGGEEFAKRESAKPATPFRKALEAVCENLGRRTDDASLEETYHCVATSSEAQRLRALIAEEYVSRLVAVSPESMTASAWSKMALATSETSARVGVCEEIMLANIWVATMTGLPAD